MISYEPRNFGYAGKAAARRRPAAIVSVGVRICIVVRAELHDDLEHRRVAEHVAFARMRLRRAQHDAQREMYDSVIDQPEP